MKNKVILFFSILFVSIYFNACLVVETKEYNFKIKKNLSGEGSIKFINIMSDNKDSAGVAEGDYQTLLDSYLNGNKLLDDMPNVKNVKKKLFEEDNQLCGEITFEFNDINDLKFYRYKDEGPWCYFLGTNPSNMFSTEAYFSSNGTFGGQTMPVVFWDSNQKDFKFKTTVTAPSEKTASLLDIWKTKGEK